MKKWIGIIAGILLAGCAAPHQFGVASHIHNGALLLPFSERAAPTCAMRAQGCQKVQLRPVAPVEPPRAHATTHVVAPAAVAAVPEADSDQDGVPDSTDTCPGTPKGVPVGPNGCPIDSDHDGVPDSLDRCPNTPQGTTVDPSGCPLPVAQPEKVSMTLAIEFDTGKADIKPRYHDQVQRVVDFMKTYPTTNAEIEGYTDNVGAAKSNIALSQRRADAVRKAIVAGGINASRVTAKGYGPANPIADNATREGRAKNRRVVATLTAMKH